MQPIDFSELIRALADRISKLHDSIQTEEATKTAMIMPFIQVLGYDVFNPNEVTPELTADVGMKKGEKVDYAIYKDGKPILIIECKHHSDSLKIEKAAQLSRYFHVTSTRFALLTNGIQYRFFTDLIEPNKMDEKPFFEFDITSISDVQLEELKKFHKQAFNLETILSTASELKYSKDIKEVFLNELNNPSKEFVKYFASRVYDGSMTQKMTDFFSVIVKKSLFNTVNELIANRLKSALERETDLGSQTSAAKAETIPVGKETEQISKIDTTVEEMEAFYIVKSILRSRIPSERIFFRDAASYFSIILDDNRTKAICRLYLNSNKKHIGVFDAAKAEHKHEILKIDDIYNHSEALMLTAISHEKP